MPRLGPFLGVGALGLAVQMAAFLLLTRGLRVPLVVATALAVEAAIVHNFFWHRRWTWRGRSRGWRDGWVRLMRFNASTGATSIAGNVLLVTILVEVCHVSEPVAALMAVAAMCVVNFALADRWVFRTGLLVPVLVALSALPAWAAEPTPSALAGWARYLAVVEADVERRSGTPVASEVLRVVLADGTFVERVSDAREAVDASLATVNDWRGAVFVPGTSLETLLRRLEQEPRVQNDIVRSRILERAPGVVRMYARIVRRSLVTVTYDTEHATTFDRRRLPRSASSRTAMTRIVEVVHPDTSRERPLAANEQHGFLWRLNTYARYTAVGDGVVVEVESVSLSRDTPFVIRAVAAPIVNRIARESMRSTLESLRRQFAGR